MPLVDRLERKFGWIAIPGIVRILAGFQLLTYILSKLNEEVFTLLILDPPAILSGQIWRLVSFAFVIPPNTGEIITIIMLFFMVFIGELLERAWGSFRMTLYVAGGILGLAAGAFLAHYGVAHGAADYFLLGTRTRGFIWVTTLLCGAAMFHPNMEIRLFGVLPVKLFWIALFDGGIVVLDFFQLVRIHPLLGVSLLLAISNFLIAFGPSTVRLMRQRGEVASRRRKFDQAKIPADESLHRCETCGKTEHDDPELEFRVAADGEEYCVDHLPGRSAD